MTNLLRPPVQGGAFDDFLATDAPASRHQPRWREEDGPLPALYLGHGAPPLFNDPVWISQLFGWSQSFPKPRAVLIVSAHWESVPLALSASAAATPLVYDFGGFHRRFYAMTYPTPDAGALATQVTALLTDTERVHEHPSRGLDHGAWVPLKVMYPYADVPVLQLSLPTSDPDRLLRVGERLRLVNDAGERLMGQPAERLLGRSAMELGLEECLRGVARRPSGRGKGQGELVAGEFPHFLDRPSTRAVLLGPGPAPDATHQSIFMRSRPVEPAASGRLPGLTSSPKPSSVSSPAFRK